MSNFSFSHSVFKRLVLQTRKNQGLFGKGLRSSGMIVFLVNKTSISTLSPERHALCAVTLFPSVEKTCSLATLVAGTPRHCFATLESILYFPSIDLHHNSGSVFFQFVVLNFSVNFIKSTFCRFNFGKQTCH